MDLAEAIPRAQTALTEARTADLGRVLDALERAEVVGAHGEPEVGVTAVVEAALRRIGAAPIRVDLDGVAGDADVAWLLARGLARLLVSPVDLSLLHGPAEIRPTSTRQALARLQSDLGHGVATLAATPDPPAVTSVTSGDVLDVIARVIESPANLAPVLWLDHLQAPALTPRHPVEVGRLLWDIRAVQQRAALAVVLSGHRSVTGELAAGRKAAFHGDGLWVTLGRPGMDTWRAVAGALALTVGDAWVRQLAELAQSHPATMLLALCLRAGAAEQADSPDELWRHMLSVDDGHTSRAMQHARTLHRLGGQILARVAQGSGPYSDPRGATIQDINRAVRRLHHAGLITQPAPRMWQVTNPLVGARLCHGLPPVTIDAAGAAAYDFA